MLEEGRHQHRGRRASPTCRRLPVQGAHQTIAERSARLGYLQVRSGKSKNAKRTMSLTDRVSAMLGARLSVGERVFEISESTLQHQHQDLRDKLGLDPEFVLHSLRHTMLTRLGEQGTDAFTIKRIADHSSITVSERYVHPSGEAMGRAFERLQNGVFYNSPYSRERRSSASRCKCCSIRICRGGGMADTEDLKSSGSQGPCGFESRPRHNRIKDLW